MIRAQLFTFLLCFASTDLLAQNRPNIDTIAFLKLRPGMPTADIAKFSNSPIDTLLWGGARGASILGVKASYLEVPGEFRFAVDGFGITQISFVASTADDRDAAAGYQTLTKQLIRKFGAPDEEYANGFRYTTWFGAKQEFSVKTVEGKNFLTINLSKVQTRAQPASPAPAAQETTPAPSGQDPQIRRKRKS